MSATGGGGIRIKYALIGLAPQSFVYDLSKSYATNGRLLQYFIAFDDLHNFWMPKEKFRKLFNPRYLASQLPAEISDINNVYFEKTQLRFMSTRNIVAEEKADTEIAKKHSDTQRENIKILDDYLSLCDKNSVRALLFLPPMTETRINCFGKYQRDEFLYNVSNTVAKHPRAVFLDGWDLAGFVNTDFYDLSHLNIQGAAKFSTILNKVIEHFEKN